MKIKATKCGVLFFFLFFFFCIKDTVSMFVLCIPTNFIQVHNDDDFVFTSLSTVFYSYQDDRRMVMKGSVQ